MSTQLLYVKIKFSLQTYTFLYKLKYTNITDFDGVSSKLLQI